MTPRGLLLCDDLLFGSKVTVTARAAGLDVAMVRSLERFAALAAESPPTAVILDLQHNGLDLPALLAALPPTTRVVGFGSHTDAATLKAAREAGCDLVLPRSKLVARVEADIAGWLAPRSV